MDPNFKDFCSLPKILRNLRNIVTHSTLIIPGLSQSTKSTNSRQRINPSNSHGLLNSPQNVFFLTHCSIRAHMVMRRIPLSTFGAHGNGERISSHGWNYGSHPSPRIRAFFHRRNATGFPADFAGQLLGEVTRRIPSYMEMQRLESNEILCQRNFVLLPFTKHALWRPVEFSPGDVPHTDVMVVSTRGPIT